MSFWRFLLRSLAHHRRMHFAVALGVMAATAVLTGALLVGDSVRGSLKHLALDRLGRIDEALVANRFFRAKIADELAAHPGFREHFESAAPVVLLPRGTIVHRHRDVETGVEQVARATGVLVVGCDERFWNLGPAELKPSHIPQRDEIVLNGVLADELGVAVGDEVALRLPRISNVPAESALGRRDDPSQGLPRLKVVEIIPAEGLGRFSLRSAQNAPRNAYVSTSALQDVLRQPDRVNALLVAGRAQDRTHDDDASRALDAMLDSELADYGLAITPIRIGYRDPQSGNDRTVGEYFSFTSDQLLLTPAAESIAWRAFAEYEPQPVLTYLANGMQRESWLWIAWGPRIPYSTITAVDSVVGIGPLLDDAGNPIALADDEIALNSWAADDLGARIGDTVRITYFEPETTHGRTIEKSARFKLKAIVPIVEPVEPFRRTQPAPFDKPPTLANDPHLTPEVEGITDRDSLASWDAPFDIDRSKLRPQDDDYWSYYRTTPKAFVSIATGQKLWSSRFGQLTSLRIAPREGLTADTLREKFLREAESEKTKLGFEFVPVKRQALQASSGTTPFGVLFLMLSLFLIAAAVMLVALLFRLGVERRASEIGIALAVGLSRQKTARLLVAEGAIVAALGGLLGVAVGIGYAWLMIAGLTTPGVWLGAIGTPFLRLYLDNPLSLVIGYASGVIVSTVTIWWSLHATRRVAVRRLLSGRVADDGPAAHAARRNRIVSRLLAATALVLLAGACATAVYALQLGGEAQAGAFLGSGAMVLTAALTLAWTRLRYGSFSRSGAMHLAGLAARNGARNPTRSALTMGLIASASFLILSVGAFRMGPSERGTGGFDYLAESDLPIYRDLNDPRVRVDLWSGDAATLNGAVILPLRVQPGDDASCNNLYRATRPRTLGVTPQMAEHFSQPNTPAFGWAASAAETAEQKANPWLLLALRSPTNDGPIPVVLDKNTAMWSLNLMQGLGEEFLIDYGEGSQVKYRVVGLLDNTVLQGSLFIGEADFVRLFPERAGYQSFLIRAPADRREAVAQALEERLGDEGFDTQSARVVLANLLAVQNTYLATFQSLGALGLLLGTFGLAAVQLRSVLERRGELALMRAAGFRRRRLAAMVMLENALLLLGGLAIGAAAAAVAIVPHWFVGGATLPGTLLLVELAAVVAIGLAAGLAAVRAVLRAPLLPALRGE